jgi:lipoprotein Spr
MRSSKALISFLVLIAISCTSTKRFSNREDSLNFDWSEKPVGSIAHKNPTEKLVDDLEPAPLKIEYKNLSANYVTDLISEFTLKWEGTPHKIGGMSKNGIDCSGFTVVMFQELFGHRFTGRRSSDIFMEVIPVKRSELRPGDLVFFKIYGRRIDHVGVYIGNGFFSHASVQKGVIFSSLSEPYYDKRFFMGGRVSEDILANKNVSE